MDVSPEPPLFIPSSSLSISSSRGARDGVVLPPSSADLAFRRQIARRLPVAPTNYPCNTERLKSYCGGRTACARRGSADDDSDDFSLSSSRTCPRLANKRSRAVRLFSAVNKPKKKRKTFLLFPLERLELTSVCCITAERHQMKPDFFCTCQTLRSACCDPSASPALCGCYFIVAVPFFFSKRCKHYFIYYSGCAVVSQMFHISISVLAEMVDVEKQNC